MIPIVLAAPAFPPPDASPAVPHPPPASAARVQARAAVDRAAAVFGPLVGVAMVRVEATGTLDVHGHFATPAAVDRYTATCRWTWYPDRHAGAWDEHLAPTDGSAATDRTIRWTDDQWWERSDDEVQTWSGQDAAAHRVEAGLLFPGLLVDGWREDSSALAATDGGVAVALADGTLRTLSFDPTSGLPAELDGVAVEPGWGDVATTATWSEPTTSDGRSWPAHARWSGHHEAWDWRITAVRYADTADPAAFATDAGPALPDPPPALTATPIAPDVWEVVQADIDARSLVVDTGGDLAILEPPVDDLHGARLLAAVQAAFPGRTARWVVPSHHHDFHAGGMAPFAAIGAIVLDTPDTDPQARARLAWPRVSTGGVAVVDPTTLPVTGSARLGTGKRAIRVYEVGSYTAHTERYLLTYLPRARLLFVGDLVRVPVGGSTAPAGPRTRGLVEAVDALHLRVDRVVPAWPVAGMEGAIPMAELRAATAR